MTAPPPPTDTATDRAVARAIRLLAASDKSELELRQRLTKAGFGPAAIEAALGRLRSAGRLNDARVAEGVLRRSQELGDSGEKTRATLRSRGLVDEGLSTDDLARAVQVARKAAAKLPPTLTREARWRRVLSTLARRGHDEETCLEAAQAVLGPPPCAD